MIKSTFQANASNFCLNCVSGTACIANDEETEEGVTLETLPLLPGYWRNSPQSLDIRTCGDNMNGNRTSPGCQGGAGEPCKEWLAGPLCTQCNETSGRFYDGDRFECNECTVAPWRSRWECSSACWSARWPARALHWPPAASPARSCVGVAADQASFDGIRADGQVQAAHVLLSDLHQHPSRLRGPVPARVAGILEKISDLVTLNFDELWKPLQCLQLRGFYDQLMVLVVGRSFWWLSPLVTGLLGCWRQRRARGGARAWTADSCPHSVSRGAADRADHPLRRVPHGLEPGLPRLQLRTLRWRAG